MSPAKPIGASAGIAALIARELVPRVEAIDRDGEYPEAFLRAFGELGGFSADVASEHGGSGGGLTGTIARIAQVGESCLASAFIFWCQTACARYLQQSDNALLKAELLPGLASGRQMASSGLSNAMKASCGIENFLLRARRVAGGYAIDGTLPWVSNLGDDHVFAAACPVDGEAGLLFFVVHCAQPGFRLVAGAHFTALEGTRTLACQFRAVFIADARVLAHPAQAADYLPRIQPAMILAQSGMAIGLARGCIGLVDAAGRTHGEINRFESEHADELRAALAALEDEAHRLARRIDGGVAADERPALLLAVLRARLAGGELSLRAASAALLHQGARGYLQGAVAQRRLREAYFIAIVTPSLKHLRREISRREALLAA